MNVLLRLFLLAAFLFIASFAQASPPLKVGDAAPSFTLSYATSDTIVRGGFNLATAVGANNIILAFYPADWSGGCTKEMCTMRDSFSDLSKLGCDVYGISGDYIYSHREWARHLSLPFKLLSDHLHAVAPIYGSFDAESGYNKRTVYLIDKQGKIAYMDLEYSVGTPDSFNKLKAAFASIK